jgi:hypothetical protein
LRVLFSGPPCACAGALSFDTVASNRWWLFYTVALAQVFVWPFGAALTGGATMHHGNILIYKK